MNLNGLILAGGKSSRMGFDKSQLNFHGVNQVQYLYDLLLPFCETVFVSGDPKKIKGDFKFIEDNYDRGGPLNGILSALRINANTNWLIVAVDMPNINSNAIQRLIDSHNQQYVATCFKDVNGLIEPLPILLSSSSFNLLLTRFEKHQDSLHQFLKETNSQHIDATDPSWLKNVNDPSQL